MVKRHSKIERRFFVCLQDIIHLKLIINECQWNRRSSVESFITFFLKSIWLFPSGYFWWNTENVTKTSTTFIPIRDLLVQKQNSVNGASKFSDGFIFITVLRKCHRNLKMKTNFLWACLHMRTKPLQFWKYCKQLFNLQCKRLTWKM